MLPAGARGELKGGSAFRWIAFGSCVLAGLSNEVSGGALSLSMRSAGAELHASTAAMQLVMTLSKLMFGAFMLLGGLLGDTYGRRRVLVYGCFGIVAASAAAAFSASAGQLATARALDGLANAAVGPLALALVMSLFPEDETPRAVGLFLGLSALGIALGPLAAGVVIQGFGWRAGFTAPALVAGLGGLGVWLFAPEVQGGHAPAPRRRGRARGGHSTAGARVRRRRGLERGLEQPSRAAVARGGRRIARRVRLVGAAGGRPAAGPLALQQPGAQRSARQRDADRSRDGRGDPAAALLLPERPRHEAGARVAARRAPGHRRGCVLAIRGRAREPARAAPRDPRRPRPHRGGLRGAFLPEARDTLPRPCS